jgi:hypothetical protein
MWRLICLLIAAAAALVAQVRADPPSASALVDSVRAMRAATMTTQPRTGHGTARIELLQSAPATQPVHSVHEVEFSFADEASLAVERKAGAADEVVKRTLVKDGRLLCYVPASSEVQKSTVVLRLQPIQIGIAPDVQQWSIREFMRLPVPIHDEQEFFARVGASPYVHVEQKDFIVRLIITEPIEKADPTGRSLDERVIEFDLLKGGMINLYSHVLRRSRGSETQEISEVLKMGWKRTGSFIVPFERIVDVVMTVNGTEVQRAHGAVQFTAFDLQQASRPGLTVAQLEIPPGTPVVDEVRGMVYRYIGPEQFDFETKPGSEDRTLLGPAGEASRDSQMQMREGTSSKFVTPPAAAAGRLNAEHRSQTLWAILCASALAIIGAVIARRVRQSRKTTGVR